MRITRLTVKHLRSLAPLEWRPAPGLNLVTGGNGAGKTSLLEAIHLLAYGRSFRGRVRDGLIHSGADALEVFAEWEEHGGAQRKAGLQHSGQAWTGRLDGAPVQHLGQLCAALAAITFEPGSHALVNGAAETRRRFLDWGLFHVEPEFLGVWRRYARALKQRNALLKQRNGIEQLDVWDAELAAAGEALLQGRAHYLQSLQTRLAMVSDELLPQLGEATFAFQPGWRREQLSLVDALLLARPRDLISGFTSVGPHRADWWIEHAARPNHEAFSRGQAKLTALCCLLAQARDFSVRRGQWPVVLLDDLASELDEAHQQRLLRQLEASGAQVFITGTEAPAGLAVSTVAMFHVEQGVLSTKTQ